MLTVIVTIKAKENMGGELISLIKQCAAKTRLETGCRLYDIYVSPEDSDRAVLVEKWESKHALDLHLETEHYKELIEKSKGLKERPDTVELFDM